MNATPTTECDSRTARLIPIAVDSIDFKKHDFDLYIRHTEQTNPTLYRGAGTALVAKDADWLASQGIKHFLIPVSQHAAYRKAMAERLESAFLDPQTRREERARVVRTACERMIDDVLLFPGQREPILAVAELSRQFVEWSRTDPDAFGYLLDLSDHDYYTTTHMVNVGVGCGLLAAVLRPGEADFISQVHQGGLLHDVGKRAIPSDILNKEGTLSEEEWALLRSHPLAGYKELQRHEGLGEVVLLMARDHHEKIDGTGYPSQTKGSDLHLAARICAVVDVFDALTASRPYRGPTPPENVLEIMLDGAGTHFDREVLEHWTKLVRGYIATDPARATPRFDHRPQLPVLPDNAVASTKNNPSVTASHREQPPIVSSRDHVDIWSDNRRRFDRKGYRTTIRAEFVHQLKPHPVRVGELFDLTTEDLSRSGLLLRTPWPLAVSELLLLQIPGPNGTFKQLYVRVARVRRDDMGWLAGVRIVETTTKSTAA